LEKIILKKTAQLHVIENILNNRGNTTFLFGISKEIGQSHSSVPRVMEPLIKLVMIKVNGGWGVDVFHTLVGWGMVKKQLV